MRNFNRHVVVICVIAIGAGLFGRYALKQRSEQPVLHWVGPTVLAADSGHSAEQPQQPADDYAADGHTADVICTCAGAPEAALQVNINAASAEELTQLPGIGPAYAQRIIAVRKQRGGFVYVEELLEVSGIGPARFSQLEHLVFVGPYEQPDE